MNQGNFWELDEVSDECLAESITHLLRADRRVMARLLAHLAEIEERRLHLQQAFPSMFEYCISVGMSEDEAGRRVCAAGVAKHFPVIYRLLAEGRLSLSVICKLKHYLTADNHEELLVGVAGLSFRKAEAWLALRFAQPDAPSKVRKLPERTMAAPVTPGSSVSASRRRGRVEPLSAHRYRVQFTASESIKAKLELAIDLMAHRNPTRDLAPVVEQALELLIVRLKKDRFGETSRPRRACNAKPERVTNAAKRRVIQRDGLQCSYVDERGRRCTERGMLEFDHHHPKGQGGGSEPENLRVLCRAHNQYFAELAYGRAHLEEARRSRRRRRDVAVRGRRKDNGPD